jgi:hypothetical protein
MINNAMSRILPHRPATTRQPRTNQAAMEANPCLNPPGFSSRRPHASPRDSPAPSLTSTSSGGTRRTESSERLAPARAVPAAIINRKGKGKEMGGPVPSRSKTRRSVSKAATTPSKLSTTSGESRRDPVSLSGSRPVPQSQAELRATQLQIYDRHRAEYAADKDQKAQSPRRRSSRRKSQPRHKPPTPPSDSSSITSEESRVIRRDREAEKEARRSRQAEREKRKGRPRKERHK